LRLASGIGRVAIIRSCEAVESFLLYGLNMNRKHGGLVTQI
jgi:hypothetical protein